MLKERDGMGPTEGAAAAASATAAAAGGGGGAGGVGGGGGASPGGAPGGIVRGNVVEGGGAATGGGGMSGGVAEAASVCAGCGCRISDRFYLLAVDRQWHSSCLKCCECKLPLHSELTCFARDGNIYCKDDYYRLFAVKRCGRCRAGISASELVMRAREAVYHVQCFTCASCDRPLTKGEHFGMRDGLVYCRSHYALLFPSPHPHHTHGAYCVSAQLEGGAAGDVGAGGGHPMGNQEGILVFGSGGEEDNVAAVGGAGRLPASGAASFFHHGSGSSGAASASKGRPRKRKAAVDLELPLRISAPGLEMLHPGDLAPAIEQLAAFDSSVGSPGSSSGMGGQQGGGGQQRTKRMRTSFKHHQLRTMKSYFAINQNPDAKDLKQLAQKTGLSKRVLQVWFQNARAKWRRNMMRQESQQSGPGGGGAPPSAPPPTCSSSSPPPPPDHHHHHGAHHLLQPPPPHLGGGDGGGGPMCPSSTSSGPPQAPHGGAGGGVVVVPVEDIIANSQGLPFGDIY